MYGYTQWLLSKGEFTLSRGDTVLVPDITVKAAEYVRNKNEKPTCRKQMYKDFHTYIECKKSIHDWFKNTRNDSF